MQSLYAKLAELLEVDEVKPEDALQDFENWDSLTVLAVIATLDSGYGVNMTGAELRLIATAGELAAAVESRKRR